MVSRDYIKLNLIRINENSFSDIKEKLKLNYNYEIDYLKDIPMNTFDKLLMNSWGISTVNENEITFNLPLENNNISFEYVDTIVTLESSLNIKKAKVGDSFLPKSNRVNSNNFPVTFVNYNNAIFCIIKGSRRLIGTFKSSLLGGRKSQDHIKAAWDNTAIDTKQITGYHFNHDFFYWLISKMETSITYRGSTLNIMKIINISDFNKERNISHENHGNGLITDATTQTSLGIKNNLDRVGIQVKIDDNFFDFIISDDGEISLNKNLSKIFENGRFIKIQSDDNEISKFMIFLYNFIIPALYASYNNDTDSGLWTSSIREHHHKKFAVNSTLNLWRELGIEVEQSYTDIASINKIKIQ